MHICRRPAHLSSEDSGEDVAAVSLPPALAPPLPPALAPYRRPPAQAPPLPPALAPQLPPTLAPYLPPAQAPLMPPARFRCCPLPGLHTGEPLLRLHRCSGTTQLPRPRRPLWYVGVCWTLYVHLVSHSNVSYFSVGDTVKWWIPCQIHQPFPVTLDRTPV